MTSDFLPLLLLDDSTRSTRLYRALLYMKADTPVCGWEPSEAPLSRHLSRPLALLLLAPSHNGLQRSNSSGNR
jgi:hypothetical protein